MEIVNYIMCVCVCLLTPLWLTSRIKTRVVILSFVEKDLDVNLSNSICQFQRSHGCIIGNGDAAKRISQQASLKITLSKIAQYGYYDRDRSSRRHNSVLHRLALSNTHYYMICGVGCQQKFSSKCIPH